MSGTSHCRCRALDDRTGCPGPAPARADRRGQRRATPSTVAPPPALEPDLESDHMLINIGPQHPATHGVLRLVLELDGETVVRCIPHVGYLHCGFEKIGEYRQYNQIIPWTDREDYLNSIGNNVAFALGAERLFGIEITPRCTVLRVIAAGAVADHLAPGVARHDVHRHRRVHAVPLDVPGTRERLPLLENWVGARLTTSATRVGGMAADIPDGLDRPAQRVRRASFRTRSTRSTGCSPATPSGSGGRSDWARCRPPRRRTTGCPGPMLRASGVAYDVRKDFPYLDYETYDFDVPVGTHGDVYDRYPRAHGGAAPVDRASWRRRWCASPMDRSTSTTRA